MAWHVLMRVERDRAFADLVLHAALTDSALARRERAFATELAYGTLRLRGRIDAVLRQCLDRDLARTQREVRNLLRLGAYQILFLSRIRNAAAVSETIELARSKGLAHAAGFLNAVLRKLARRAERDGFSFPDPKEDPVGYLTDWGSLPAWLAERWLAELGPEEARALAEVCTKAPPRTIRVSARIDRDAVARRLRGRPCRFAPRGVTGVQLDPVLDPAWVRGELTVQDEASQLVPLLLGAEPEDTVVDCCAAPGGKAVQLAEQVGPKGEVIALELHEARLTLIHRAARRLNLANLRVLRRDVGKGFDLQGRLRFKRILVDAPCSGLGTLRRNPDARWRLLPEEIPGWAERGLGLLSSAARYVEEGGVLVYSVCTHTPEETVSLITRFLDHEPGFRVDDPRPYLPPAAAKLVDGEGALRTFPHRHGCDGFYAVRLVRA